MSLLRRKHSDLKVKDARREVDLAIQELEELFDSIEEQTIKAKEGLDERRAG